ncbi:MAG: hypothetical protein WAM60_14580 [Candidatus Promineifilaceae bacterium]
MIDSRADPNMPDGRFFGSELATTYPAKRRHNWRTAPFDSADLAGFPEYHDMLVLPSRASTPGPSLTSFTTGTTLPPPADPLLKTDRQHGLSSPLQTACRGEHVVLLL